MTDELKPRVILYYLDNDPKQYSTKTFHQDVESVAQQCAHIAFAHTDKDSWPHQFRIFEKDNETVIYKGKIYLNWCPFFQLEIPQA